MDLKLLIEQIADVGFQSVFTGMVLLLGYKWADKKFFGTKAIEKTRQAHRELDEAENEQSKNMIKKIQSYLNDRAEDLEAMGIDRTSVWINHNGQRHGKIHFIFYSLIAELSAKGLQKFTDGPIGSQKLPYYIFAEYEELISKQEGPVFISDQEFLGQTSKSIASDMGTKSLIVAPVYSLKGKIDGMIFFSSVFEPLTEKPDLDRIIIDIRSAFIS